MSAHEPRILVSVIVPAHNAARTADACVEALLRQEFPPEQYEVVVVDDGSTDATAAIAGRPGVHVVRQPHLGRAAARNAGAQLARGVYLLFTDADCAPAPDWLRQMVSALVGVPPRPGAAGAKGVYRSRQRALLARIVQLEYEDKYERLARQESIDFVDTYSAGYRREVFLASGGFRIDLPAAEDAELSFRLATMGYRLVFAPAAVVYHQHGTSWRSYLRRKLSYGRWRAKVYRQYPGKALGDSHTPRILWLQLPLASLVVGGAALALARPRAALAAVLAALAFLATTLPFSLKAIRRDRPAGLVAPLAMFARAVALGCGLLIGTIEMATRVGKRSPG